ncbi:MAG TPA: type III polyketide synthase [Chitinophagaceae bacterium]|nr:type III polyketide synthase [Chitinophagaceae bacterium]
MSKIISIAKALPPYRHAQMEVCGFMKEAYGLDGDERRKLDYLYRHSGIDFRYSVIPDYSPSLGKREFYSRTISQCPSPSLETRMEWFHTHALPLSLKACRKCLRGHISPKEVTHLVTVSCTGLSAPGLDISIVEHLKLPTSTIRTSLNFMGCYGALHALKMADAFCRADRGARVLVVCTELCTLHFQKEYNADHATSGLLFADGSAAALVTAGSYPGPGLMMESFWSDLLLTGKKDMTWELSDRGFQMRLSAYIPRLVSEGIGPLLNHALLQLRLTPKNITHWAIHPGGKKILEAVRDRLGLDDHALDHSFRVLKQYGNMSSPTILFVLESVWKGLLPRSQNRIFAAAFGPGLTLESLILLPRSR